MDMEKSNEPIFKIDEERLEKFLKEMPEEVKEPMKNLTESNAWIMLLFMMFFAVPNDFESIKRSDIMQDCKECVHNKVCTEFSKIGLFPNCKASSLIQKRVIDKEFDCEHFRKEIYGKWIKANCKCLDCFYCDKCGETSHQKMTGWDNGKLEIVFSKFCPNCGIRMDGAD